MSRARWITAAVGVALLLGLLLGLLVPNNRLEQVTLFWWWHWQAPLWAILALAMGLGVFLGGLLVGLLWLRELQKRLRAVQRGNEIEAEVNALRRLLARPQASTQVTLPAAEPTETPGD